MTEQAAQDPNMPPVDEPETVETVEEGQAETATAKDDESQFVSQDT